MGKVDGKKEDSYQIVLSIRLMVGLWEVVLFLKGRSVE